MGFDGFSSLNICSKSKNRQKMAFFHDKSGAAIPHLSLLDALSAHMKRINSPEVIVYSHDTKKTLKDSPDMCNVILIAGFLMYDK